MKPTWVDRLFVAWLAAALTLWGADLAILWGMAFDLSGTGAWMALAAGMLALWATAGVPGWVARLAQRLLPAFNLADALGLDPVGGMPVRAGRSEVRALMRLLAGAAAVAGGCGLASTAAVYAARGVGEALGRTFLLGPTAWAAARLALEFLGAVPLALAVSLTFLVTVLVRGGSGRDVYAAAFREWLFGAAGGLAAAAVAWWAGADPLGVAAVACVAVLATSLVLLQRMRLTIRPRQAMSPIEPGPRRGRQWAVAATFGCVAVAVLAQVRLLRDVAGAGPGGQAIWAGATLALLGWFLRACDRRSRAAGRAQALAATLGALAAVTMQCGLAVAALGGGPLGAVCLLLAAGAQVPASALAAVVISRQRRTFAQAGGRARRYLGSAAGGVGVGVLLYLGTGALSAVGAAGLTGAIAAMAAAVVWGIPTARRPGGQVQWAAVGAVLLLAAGATPVLVLRSLPPLAGGEWLTTAWPGPAEPAAARRLDYCLGPRRWRSAAVSGAAEQVLAARGGKWWLVASAPQDRPGALPPSVRASWALADPTASHAPAPAGQEGGFWGDYLEEASRGPRRFDGLLLAPLPADHPEAWRCYQQPVLRRCWDKLHDGGVLIVRTQAAPGQEHNALAVAQAVAEIVQGGWVVLALSDEGLDLAVVAVRRGGAAGLMPSEADPAEGLFVLPLDRLCAGQARGGAAGLSGRGWFRPGRADRQELADRWRRLQAELFPQAGGARPHPLDAWEPAGRAND